MAVIERDSWMNDEYYCRKLTLFYVNIYPSIYNNLKEDIFFGLLLQLRYYSNNTPEIHRKQSTIPFIPCKRVFLWRKEKQHQFPVVKRPILSSSSKPRGCYSDSHHAQFLSGEIIPSKQKCYGLILWFTICSFSKACKVGTDYKKYTKLKESL